MSRYDIDPEDLPLLYLGDSEPEDPGSTKSTNLLDPNSVEHIEESIRYSPAIGVRYMPTNAKNSNASIAQDQDASISLLDHEFMIEDDEEDHGEPDDEPANVSSILEYYSEAALTAAQRNKIDDSEFGLPRTRQYPLHDEKHIKQAVRMFGHCKDPEDRKILAANIFKKAEEQGITLNVGKQNPLYKYVPKKLQESSGLILERSGPEKVFGLEQPMEKRTREDVIREHMRMNRNFYNLVFYGDDFLRAIKQLEEFKFFDYFYPNFRTHNLYQRLKCSLGGLGMDRDLYQRLKIRYPLETDSTLPLGDFVPTDPLNIDIQMAMEMSYDTNANWFKTEARDVAHLLYCLRLYSVLGAIMNDRNFTMEQLSVRHQGLLLDWLQHVQYNYDLLLDTKEGTPEHLTYMQKLFDLGWNYTENPMDTEIIVANVTAMCDRMAMAQDIVGSINESTPFLDKTDCAGYMVKELGLDDDVFLLPGTMEYPVIDKGSVRMAMDRIARVEAEHPDLVEEYARNLNRKYKELGCTFSISVDHPFAQYADKAVIDHMSQVLMEGDTVVKDHGTSSGRANPVEDGPWYVDHDTNGAVAQNLLDNKELKPDEKPKPPLDYTRHYSIL